MSQFGEDIDGAITYHCEECGELLINCNCDREPNEFDTEDIYLND